MLNYMYDVAQIAPNRKPETNLTIKTWSSKKVLLKLRHLKTEKFRKSLTYTGPKKWNNLPSDFHHAPCKFKYKSLVSDWVARKALRNEKLANDYQISLNLTG